MERRRFSTDLDGVRRPERSERRDTPPNSLNSVSCASATSCQAVGDYSPAGEVQTLVASWNGAASPPTWTASAGPNVLYGGERVRNILNGVSCAEATSCQAVGNYDNDRGATSPRPGTAPTGRPPPARTS